MKILIIAAKHHPHSMNFAHCMDIVGAKYSHMPLVLPTLAALTPTGWDLELVDENTREIPFNTDAKIVCISGSVPQRKRVFEIAQEFRARGTLVAIGGPIAFDMLEECRREADVVFVGEAEHTWPRFLREYQAGKHQDLYRQEDWIEIGDSPVPRYDLLDARDYASACLQVTRGCPQRCVFCDIPVKYGSQPRSKPVAQVLEEIRILSGLGYEAVFIVDDNFVGNPRYAKELLRAIAKILPSLPTRMYFYTQATLTVANDEEMMRLMRDASMRRLFIGIETGDPRRLDELNKTFQSSMDIGRATKALRSHGITVWAGIMFGLEGDDPSSFERQFEFIRDTNLIPVQIGLLQAVPETPLYRRARAENRVEALPSIFGVTALSEEELSKGSNLIHRTMPEKEIDLNFARVLRRLFAPEFFRRKMIQYMDSGARPLSASTPPLNLRLLRILARTLAYYLFKTDAPTRRMFFQVIGELVSRRLRSLDEVVFHLVIYKHMRTHYYRIADLCEATQGRVRVAAL